MALNSLFRHMVSDILVNCFSIITIDVSDENRTYGKEGTKKTIREIVEQTKRLLIQCFNRHYLSS